MGKDEPKVINDPTLLVEIPGGSSSDKNSEIGIVQQLSESTTGMSLADNEPEKSPEPELSKAIDLIRRDEELQAKILNKEEEIGEIERSMSINQAEQERIINEIDALNSKIVEAEGKLKNEQEKLEGFWGYFRKKKPIQSEIKTLLKELNKLKADKENLEKRLSALCELYTDMQFKIDKLRKEISQLSPHSEGEGNDDRGL